KVSLDDVDDVIDLKKKIKKEISPMLDAYSVDRLILKATKTNIQEANNATELDERNKLVDILNEFRVPYDGASIKRFFAKNIILFVYVISISINKVSDVLSHHKLMIISEERLTEFDQLWDQHKINLLSSPPASENTIFAKWFELYSKNKAHVARHISMINLYMFPDILIDEVQILYGGATFFWHNIKTLQDNPNHNLHVMLIDHPIVIGCDYIPIEFEHALGMEQLRLKRTEYDKLVEKFIKVVYANESYKLTIPADVTDAIFNATARHPHLIRKSLSCLKNYFRSGHKDASDMSRYIMSSAYFSGTCVFNWLVNLQMTNDNVNFLRHAYYGVDSTSTFSINPGNDQMYQTAKKFKCLGLITEVIKEGCYQFVAPIVIGQMRSLILLNSLSRNISESARLIERQLQTEWLLAATTAILLGSSINPDVEGKIMADLIDHFDREGKHSNIPLACWAIIDFQHKSTVLKKLESNV
ncbi:11690_t:CDS:2, partial [Gigaspora margarita]